MTANLGLSLAIVLSDVVSMADDVKLVMLVEEAIDADDGSSVKKKCLFQYTF